MQKCRPIEQHNGLHNRISKSHPGEGSFRPRGAQLLDVSFLLCLKESQSDFSCAWCDFNFRLLCCSMGVFFCKWGIFSKLLMRMDKSLHDFVEIYAHFTLELRGKTRHLRRSTLVAARGAAANFARRLCRFFPRSFGVIFRQIVQRFVHLPNYCCRAHHATPAARRPLRPPRAPATKQKIQNLKKYAA